MKYLTYSPMTMYSIEFFSLKLLGENFENVLEITGKIKRI